MLWVMCLVFTSKTSCIISIIPFFFFCCLNPCNSETFLRFYHVRLEVNSGLHGLSGTQGLGDYNSSFFFFLLKMILRLVFINHLIISDTKRKLDCFGTNERAMMRYLVRCSDIIFYLKSRNFIFDFHQWNFTFLFICLIF